MNLDDVLKTFIVESQELLQQMEEALLRIEQDPHDPETVNAIFRAAHTIKGSAGLFGLDAIVAFTHVAESVLDRIRCGELTFDCEMAALFLEVCDYLGGMIAQVAAGTFTDGQDPESQALGLLLTARLERHLLTPECAAPLEPVEQEPRAETDTGGCEVAADHWHLSLRFGPDVLRNGMDPLAFLRYLGTLGRIANIVTLTDGVPAAAEMDPETCYLGFELAFVSDADLEAIESAFDFVREDSSVRILPPHGKLLDYRQLIRELPEDDLFVGDVLLRCGTLTRQELDEILRDESEPADAFDAPDAAFETCAETPAQDLAAAQPAATQKPGSKTQGGSEANLIRVDAAKLDQLIDLVGELIIAGAGTQLAAKQSGIAALVESTGVLSRLVEYVRDSALKLRMVQIGTTFNRFQRVVRDVSKELGKDIVLDIGGADTELDKTVVEKIGDPLTHLVRNAVDHGIESAELRLARGKPARGTVRLNAYHEASSIVIEVSDDGGGLDKERILRKALDRGLVDDSQHLSDREILNLIFEPGFSTAEQISNLSGRGVGMDVVKKNIMALRGTVDLDSEAGVGTTVRIRLPLTLAIIDGFMIGVGKTFYVIPLDVVEECVALTPAQAATARQGGDYVDLRGEALPFIRLREIFDVEEPAPRRENVVVVRYAGMRAGLVVDQLLGEFQTVIKPIGKVFGNNPSLGGFTILGSGGVALILNIPGLIGQITQRQAPATRPPNPAPITAMTA